jgi:hypothetical protein
MVQRENVIRWGETGERNAFCHGEQPTPRSANRRAS